MEIFCCSELWYLLKIALPTIHTFTKTIFIAITILYLNRKSKRIAEHLIKLDLALQPSLADALKLGDELRAMTAEHR